MPDTPKHFYLTTPIYYVNARPHIGHAYSTIVADVLARRHRLLGDDTYFLTGTDEHGQKIERSAAAAGIAPQQFADQVSKTFADLWARMGITNNDYIRTTDDRHKRGAQKLFTELYDRNEIYLASYTGQYSVGEEMFVEGPPGTIGPDGRPTETVTEENFFFRLSNYQLPLLNLIESNELLITPESSRNEVLSFIRGNISSPTDVSSRPEAHSDGAERPASVAATLPLTPAGHHYVPGALRDLSISRSSFTWGIPVPEAIQQKENTAQKHVIYVWLDALTNYMTALGYGSDDTTLFDKFWPANIHLVGKEITRFHCVYWPAFLLAAGLPVPKQVTANGWLLFDNSKMSKSKGNVVRTETILDAFGTLCPPPQKPSVDATDQVPQGFSLGSHIVEKDEGVLAHEPTPHERDLFAADVLRYYLLREIPFGQDGSFSFDTLITRYNADLANGYGNLVSRTLAMIAKYYNGVIPNPKFDPDEVQVPSEDGFDASLLGRAGTALQNRIFELSETDFTTILTEINAYITTVDGFISSSAPWKLAKDPASADRLATVLYLSAEAIRWITGLLHPYIPFITAKVWAQLGLGSIEDAARDGELARLYFGGLPPGTPLGTLGPIFPRADKGLAQIMTDIEESNTKPTTPSTTAPDAAPRTSSLPEPSGTLTVGGSIAHTTGPSTLPSHTEAPASGIFAAPAAPAVSDQITIDDFTKIELRVAQIVVAERIPKADKLLRLEVDLGPEFPRRQILSGIAEFYTPEELIGRRIVVITNLAPRKMRGLESHGMLLAASDTDHGKPHLATCGDDIALGSRLK
jgi:methionyl-tRNA synthetase